MRELASYPPVIAIDGPAASGKTTVGRALAKRLGYLFVDTSVFYRAATLAALDSGTPLDDAPALARLAETISVAFADGGDRVLIDGADATPRLRGPEVDAAVSPVSAVPGVRAALLGPQREAAAPGSVVMAGRDVGSVVLPDAAKIYLEASPEERTRRRFAELAASDAPRSERAVRENLALRDETDSRREAAPLAAAPDAVRLVTDGLAVEEVVERVLAALGAERPA